MEKFKSTPNEVITKENIGERKFYISRSPAVVGTIIIKKGGETYVLMGKRGPGTPDFQGYWNMPCGYLDWDESATEAIYRELYEETGLELEDFIRNLIPSAVIKYDLDQPWFVNHQVSSNRQNVTLRFGVVVELLENDKFPNLSNKNCEPGEVDELRWINVKDVKNLKCAFGHDQVLKDYLDKQ